MTTTATFQSCTFNDHGECAIAATFANELEAIERDSYDLNNPADVALLERAQELTVAWNSHFFTCTLMED